MPKFDIDAVRDRDRLANPPMPSVGIFFGGALVQDIGSPLPAQYRDKHVTVRFASGLQLNCLGSQVEELSRERS